MLAFKKGLDQIKRQKVTPNESLFLGAIGLVHYRANTTTTHREKEWRRVSRNLIKKATQHYNQAQINYATDKMKEAVRELNSYYSNIEIDTGLLGIFLLDRVYDISKKVFGIDFLLLAEVIPEVTNEFGKDNINKYYWITDNLERVLEGDNPISLEDFNNRKALKIKSLFDKFR
jgi:hypothetical protein